jgi:hypothetical protein
MTASRKFSQDPAPLTLTSTKLSFSLAPPHSPPALAVAGSPPLAANADDGQLRFPSLSASWSFVTMKPMSVPKRLPYSFATRPRSNSTNSRSFYTQPTVSPLAFFDAPPVPHTPSPSSRPTTIGSSLRLVQPKPEAETSHQSNGHSHGYAPPLFSAVLSSSPHSQSQNTSNYPQVFPYLPYPQPTHLAPAAATDAQPAETSFDVDRPRYQLDVGAYGIPKDCKSASPNRDFLHRRSGPSVCENAALATQVGEDAYFITENAMGVADGVGGWKNRSGVC